MKRILLLFLFPVLTFAQASESDAIQRVMHMQVEAWNRGDVTAFMSSYEDSPDTTFVGDKVEHGFAQILERYHRNYGTPAAMGKLTFSKLEVRVLDAKYAVATGNFHLDRNAAGGGNADGIFSLMLRKGPSGWKIILDHSNRTH
jgi:uncharacterized protein (TIGR02246 family)